MKKRSILTVLIALFLVLIISCTDSSSDGGSNDTGGNGGDSGGGGGLEVDNESTFNLGYYIRGEGKQQSIFKKWARNKLENNYPSYWSAGTDPHLPTLMPSALHIPVDPDSDITYTMTDSSDGYLLFCFDFQLSKGVCNATLLKNKTDTISSSVLIGVNQTKLADIVANNTTNLAGSFEINNSKTNETKKYFYKVKFINAVTPDCLSGFATDPDIPGLYECNSPDTYKAKFTLNDANPLAGFPIWDFVTEGVKIGYFENLKLEFANNFFDTFELDSKTTCKIVNNVISVDKNCDIFIKKKTGITGESTLTMTGLIDVNLGSQGSPLNETYTFIAE